MFGFHRASPIRSVLEEVHPSNRRWSFDKGAEILSPFRGKCLKKVKPFLIFLSLRIPKFQGMGAETHLFVIGKG